MKQNGAISEKKTERETRSASYMDEDKMKKMKTVTCKYYDTRYLLRKQQRSCYVNVK